MEDKKNTSANYQNYSSWQALKKIADLGAIERIKQIFIQHAKNKPNGRK